LLTKTNSIQENTHGCCCHLYGYLIYNAPLEYVEPVLSGEIEGYLREYTDYQSSMES